MTTASQYYPISVELADMLTLFNVKATPLTFLYPSAGNQQFQTFIKTAQSLFEICGQQVSINKYDDPLSVCTSLLTLGATLELKLPSFPPAALRTGAGDAVVAFLHALATKALEASNFTFSTPRIEAAASQEDAEHTELHEISSEEPFAFPSLPSAAASQPVLATTAAAASSKVVETEWLQEVERASVRLSREGIEGTSTSLGGRVAEMNERMRTMAKERKILEPALTALKEEVERFMETVEREERAAQDIFRSEGLADKARANRLRLKELNASIHIQQDKVHNLEEELKFLDENLENAKSQLDDWSDVATDTQPVVRMKEAIKKIKDENKAMDLRIAVLHHTLYEARANRLFLQ